MARLSEYGLHKMNNRKIACEVCGSIMKGIKSINARTAHTHCGGEALNTNIVRAKRIKARTYHLRQTPLKAKGSQACR